MGFYNIQASPAILTAPQEIMLLKVMNVGIIDIVHGSASFFIRHFIKNKWQLILSFNLNPIIYACEKYGSGHEDADVSFHLEKFFHFPLYK